MYAFNLSTFVLHTPLIARRVSSLTLAASIHQRLPPDEASASLTRSMHMDSLGASCEIASQACVCACRCDTCHCKLQAHASIRQAGRLYRDLSIVRSTLITDCLFGRWQVSIHVSRAEAWPGKDPTRPCPYVRRWSLSSPRPSLSQNWSPAFRIQ